jgi:hypothetical protein
MKRRTPLAAGLALMAIALGQPPAMAAEELPIFDTHIHYSREAWGPYDPGRIMDTLDAAGVARALVSSTPDEGTLRLYRHDKDRVVPILRPYHGDVNAGNWTRAPGIVAYIEERLRRGIYRGIGEFHLFEEDDARSAPVRGVVALAVARDIVLHVHAGAASVRALFAIDAKVKVLWAHAGFSTPPEVVGELLERYPRLSAEVAFRATDIAPGGRGGAPRVTKSGGTPPGGPPGGGLDEAWRALFLSHPDRFMIGTDTYVTGRWDTYGGLIEEHRRWLAQLPGEVARAIAYGNAVARFGAGGGLTGTPAPAPR